MSLDELSKLISSRAARRAVSLSIFIVLISSCGEFLKKPAEESNVRNVEPAVEKDQATLDAEADNLAVEGATGEFDILGVLGGNSGAENVTENLVLFDSIGDDVSIEWKSENTSIDNDGVVIRPLFGIGNDSGDFHAILTRGDSEKIVSVTFIVSEDPPEDSQAVAADSLELTEEAVLIANPSLDRITTNLNLPALGTNKSTIVWETTVTALTLAGIVTREPYFGTHSTGTLKATITKGRYSSIVEFELMILREPTKLLITEVYPGYFIDDGWIEVHNMTDQPIDLSLVSIRGMTRIADANQLATETLPAFTLAANGYIILHSAPSGVREGQLIDGPTDIYLDKIYFYQGLFAELIEDGVPLDFVRWQKEGFANTNSPTSGKFLGNASNPSRFQGAADEPPGGSTIGRVYGYFDADSGDDWTFFPLGSPGGPNGLATPEGTDTDGDGLSDSYEVDISTTDPLKRDSDGDGFSDGEEVLDEGLAGINLREMGADPNIRDIFVEIDYMVDPAGISNSLTDSMLPAGSLSLRKAALDKVKAVFDSYIPDGDDANQNKIAIHFDAGDLFDPADGINSDNYDLGGGNSIPFADCIYLGEVLDPDPDTPAGDEKIRNPGNCSNLYTIKQTNLEVARRYIFHYLIVAWSQEIGGPNTGSSGRAEINGNDIILSLGSWPTGSGTATENEDETVNFQAATILHELGHNLGLKHGGDEDVNYKPNYMSTMNYMYQLYGLDLDGNGDIFYRVMGYSTYYDTFGVVAEDLATTDPLLNIGYSYGGRSPLAESAIVETTGWGGADIDFDDSGTIANLVDPLNKLNIQYVDPAVAATVAADPFVDKDDWNSLNLGFQASITTDWNGAPIIKSRVISPICLGRP